MIVITAQGRLAHQPELKLLPSGVGVCEFRLLSTRFAKGAEVTEAVTFVCFGEEAESFCEGVEKGQLISATGTQETNSYKDASGQARTFVKYRLTWYQKGPRPRGDRQTGDGFQPQRAPSSHSRGTEQGYRSAGRPVQAAVQPQAPQRNRHEHHASEGGGNSHGDFDDVSLYV